MELETLEKNIKEIYHGNNSVQKAIREGCNNIDFGTVFDTPLFGNFLICEDLIIDWFKKNHTEFGDKIKVTPTPFFEMEKGIVITDDNFNEIRNFNLLRGMNGQDIKEKKKSFRCTNYDKKIRLSESPIHDTELYKDIIDCLIRQSLKSYMKESVVIRYVAFTGTRNDFQMVINGVFF